MTASQNQGPEPLIGFRAAVTLFFASAVSGAAGVLTHLAGDSLPAAALAAGAAFAISAATFHNLVGRS
jgi:hypothetical protein